MIEQLQESTSVHNLLHIIQFKGTLDFSVLKQSLDAVVQRHEVLRTSFSNAHGKPTQKIAPKITWELPLLDLRHISSEQWEAEAMQHGFADAAQPFDLNQAPLWRFTLLRFSNEYHILLRTIHHIIFDGWSHNVFMRELGTFYKSVLDGQPSPLLKLPIQYADFAQTQQAWLQSNTYNTQLNYWQKQLADNVASLQLPTHAPTAALSTYAGNRQPIILSKPLTEAIKSLSYQQGVSMFVTLLAAFKVLLHRYKEQGDMMVCSPVVGRQRSETRGLIGYFNNVVVLRTDVSGNPSFRELLERVSQVTLDAYANQDVPMQELVKLPSMAQTTLTRAMFVLQNTPNQVIKLPDVEIQSQYVERDVADFDLALSLQEEAEQLSGTLRYRTGLFEVETIQQMVENFQAILEILVANPDLQLSELPAFTVDEVISAPTKSDSENSFVAPREEIEHQLADIWSRILGIESVGIHDNFFQLGGSSLMAVRLFAEIEQVMGTNLPIATLLQAPTIEKLAKLVRQKNHHELWQSALVPIQPNGTKPPLFCIHGAGLNVLVYKNLSDHLGEDYPVYGVQAVSPDGSGPHARHLDQVVSHYLEEIRRFQPDGPYFLAGLSKGGNLALKIAQMLHAQGQEVALVAMFDSNGPNANRLLSPVPRFLSSLRYAMRYSLPRSLTKLSKSGLKPWLTSSHRQMIHNSPKKENYSNQEKYRQKDPRQLRNNRVLLPMFGVPILENWMDQISQYILEHSPWIRVYNPLWGVDVTDGSSIAAKLNELREVYEEIYKTESHEKYDGQITLFRAKEQPPGYHFDPYLGWNAIARQGVEIHKIPGDHTSIMRSQILANKLKSCIDQAMAKTITNSYTNS
jgi:thioesterase domain-containing protein/acyl carrier protein